jgi:hypothetical protein
MIMKTIMEGCEAYIRKDMVKVSFYQNIYTLFLTG